MNHRNLRSSVIRLAHANPALRPHLLPLLGVRTADDKSFDEAVKGKKFRNPATGNDVVFDSLPYEEQKKVRESWSKKNEGGGEKGGSDSTDHNVKGANERVKESKSWGDSGDKRLKAKDKEGALWDYEEARGKSEYALLDAERAHDKGKMTTGDFNKIKDTHAKNETMVTKLRGEGIKSVRRRD